MRYLDTSVLLAFLIPEAGGSAAEALMTVLELKVPHGSSLDALLPLAPVLLSYVLSFVYVAIYWNNHHHMLHVVHKVGGGVLWANLRLAVRDRHRPVIRASMARFRDPHRCRDHVADPDMRIEKPAPY